MSEVSPSAENDALRMLNHRVPLSPDDNRWAHLTLPMDLTTAEAERLAAFVAALVIPPAADQA